MGMENKPKIIRCCKANSLKCKNSKCIHWHKHTPGFNYLCAFNVNHKCSKWSWCSYLNEKVRCI